MSDFFRRFWELSGHGRVHGLVTRNVGVGLKRYWSLTYALGLRRRESGAHETQPSV
jgi:hypothetical protein